MSIIISGIAIISLSILIILTLSFFVVSKIFKLNNSSLKNSFIISILNIIAIIILVLLLLVFKDRLEISLTHNILLWASLDAILTGVSAIVFILLIVINYFIYRKYFIIGFIKSFFLYILWNVLATILLFLLLTFIRIYILQPYIVEGISMRPTFGNGSYILINKISKAIKRNDIVVYTLSDTNKKTSLLSNNNLETNLNSDFIGRVAAVPGDTFEFRNNYIYINNEKIGIIPGTENFLDDPDQVNYQLTSHGYYILGDNRDHSFDSRYFGFIAKDNIVGKVLNKAIYSADLEPSQLDL